jgi:hypothetical protein
MSHYLRVVSLILALQSTAWSTSAEPSTSKVQEPVLLSRMWTQLVNLWAGDEGCGMDPNGGRCRD